MAKAASKTSRASADKRQAAQSPEQREAAEAAKHAPVSLESGASYDMGQLQKGLDRAVDRRSSNRDAEVSKALEAAKTEAAMTSAGAPNSLPNHVLMETETRVAEGVEVGSGKDKRTVGEVTVTEYRQVFDADAAGDDVSRADVVGAIAAGSGGRSDIISATIVGETPALVPPSDGDAVFGQDGETGEPSTTGFVDEGAQGDGA